MCSLGEFWEELNNGIDGEVFWRFWNLCLIGVDALIGFLNKKILFEES